MQDFDSILNLAPLPPTSYGLAPNTLPRTDTPVEAQRTWEPKVNLK